MNVIKSLLTEDKNNVSVGSTCIMAIVITYIILCGIGFFIDKKPPLDGYEVSSIVGVLYGLKKVPQILEKKNGKNVGY